MATKTPSKALFGIGALLAAAIGAFFLFKKKPPPEPPPGLANLYGTVTDVQTGKALSGVAVALNGMEASTGADGSYIFENIEPGSYAAIFSKEGYETKTF